MKNHFKVEAVLMIAVPVLLVLIGLFALMFF